MIQPGELFEGSGSSEAAFAHVPISCALGHSSTALDTGWEHISTAPGVFTTPVEAESSNAWAPARVPGTVACLEAPESAAHADARDHWYRLRITAPPSGGPELRRVLCFDGLATLAEVWLDGVSILVSDNMFLAHACDVTKQLARPGEHVVVIRFAALRPVLQQRRPRGRWPTRLISQKHLRFVRTSFLGYMPGWYPALPVIGPWRKIYLVEQTVLAFERCHLRPTLDGDCGVLSIKAEGRLLGALRVRSASLRMEGGAQVALDVTVEGDRVHMVGALRVPQVAKWWPHTHGFPTRHAAMLVLNHDAGEQTLDLGRVGFRALGVQRDTDGQGFGLRINQRDVFCRGACWATLDPATVDASVDVLRTTLEQARDAGFNMLRVGGTMVYESDAFYALCDELGILVWQDFMFANLDYPVDDAAFVESCRREARQLLARIGARCCLAVLCGGSEVHQQAAMMGLPREQWSNALFDEVLPALCREADVDAAYVPSSPSGGALPFHVNAGVGHYYGVGAYLRPLTDVRIADVRFASECLAFSNPPEPTTLERWLGKATGAALDPRYRDSVPRDPGASWDFADVSDHYVSILFGVDPRALRANDPDHYLDLSRVAVGEAMSTVVHHMRRRDSTSRGALVWMLRDPHRAAGWGLIDGDGVPKAAYYFLKRACAPRALWFSDEGVNGLVLHADNETDASWEGSLDVSLYRPDGLRVAHAQRHVEVPRESQRCWNVEALIGHFVDASYAYRFGEPSHCLAAARLVPTTQTGREVTAFYDIRADHPANDAQVQVHVERTDHGEGVIVLQCAQVTGHVALSSSVPGVSDNYFRLEPGIARRVRTTWPAATLQSVASLARVLRHNSPATV